MSSPCQNGTCEDGFETFTCNCSPGFAGELCDLGIYVQPIYTVIIAITIL